MAENNWQLGTHRQCNRNGNGNGNGNALCNNCATLALDLCLVSYVTFILGKTAIKQKCVLMLT
jgi:hypothetical protein